jgi:hypothetical protein
MSLRTRELALPSLVYAADFSVALANDTTGEVTMDGCDQGEGDDKVDKMNPAGEPKIEDADETAEAVGGDETDEEEDKQSDLNVPGGKGLVQK